MDLSASGVEPRLSDGVVTLRPADERDLPAIAAGIVDPDVIRWIGPPEGSPEAVLALNRRRWTEGSPTFAICDAHDTCVGHVWLNRSRTAASTGSVGYWLLPAARGDGLATRAVRLLCAWAGPALGVSRIRLTTERANERSQAVAKRSGFVRVETLPAHGEIDGRSVDNVFFELPTARGNNPAGQV